MGLLNRSSQGFSSDLDFFFFLNDPATTEIYPLPLRAALPISSLRPRLVTSRTALMTLILLPPTSVSTTENSVFSSAGAAPPAAAPPKEKTEFSDVLTDVGGDRKSTRLNSSHLVISYAVFCLKK